MLILYDRVTAIGEKGGIPWFGRDPNAIRYAGVSSCLAVTVVYDDALLGAHLALFTGKQTMTTLVEVNWTFQQMMGFASPNAKVRRALLIGNTGTWLGMNGATYKYIKKFCTFLDPKYAHEEKWETPEHPAQCDIIVQRKGTVYYTYTEHDKEKPGQNFNDLSFELH